LNLGDSHASPHGAALGRRATKTEIALPTTSGVAPSAAAETTEFGVQRANALVLSLAAHSKRRGGGGGGRGGSGRSTKKGLLSDDELRAIEEKHPDGITAVQVVDIFVSRGVRFSEATFRKYVQQGLLPRSKRVGRKGRHRGSLGMYPARTVRRVNAIKRLMGEGYTIEEIQEQFLRFTDVIESLEEGLTEVFTRLDSEAQSARFDAKTRRDLKREIAEARKTADELLGRIDGLAKATRAPRKDQYRSTGAAGSAEDLL
jgi:DNA-binding transcriptional MerR regulator